MKRPGWLARAVFVFGPTFDVVIQWNQ